VELNAVEDCPADPYTAARVERLTVKMAKTPSDFDKLRQFLEMDRKVLRFYCMLDDRDRLFGQFKKFILHVRYVTLHCYLVICVCDIRYHPVTAAAAADVIGCHVFSGRLNNRTPSHRNTVHNKSYVPSPRHVSYDDTRE